MHLLVKILIFCFFVTVTQCIIYMVRHSTMKRVETVLPADASDVTWAHAVNSREALLKELNGPVMFLEADISLGQVNGSGPAIPIMAHPPADASDISFETWLKTIIEAKKQKGIKLDFKLIEVVEPCLKVMKGMEDELKFPVWLNADVIPGPVDPRHRPVDPDQFLTLCSSYFPESTLSLGWTTNWNSSLPPSSWMYTWEHVRRMASLLSSKKIKQPLTFPVRALYATRSVPQLSWLLRTVPNSTLTVWNSKIDPASVEELLSFRSCIPKPLAYYDLLRLTEAFNVKKNQIGECI